MRAKHWWERTCWVVGGGLVAMLLWYVVPMLACGLWEMYHWAFGQGNPHTWDDGFKIAPAYGFPHWAKYYPLRAYLVFCSTWVMLDGVFCLTGNGARRLLREHR